MNIVMTAICLAASFTSAADRVPESNMVLLPVASDPTISIRLWFRAGSQNDPPGKEGLASLTGAILSDGGTRQNPYEQILKKLYPMAAGYGVSVDKEMTCSILSSRRDA